jgi:serine/threonine protein kinase
MRPLNLCVLASFPLERTAVWLIVWDNPLAITNCCACWGMEPETHEQFRREAHTIAHLQHRHIIRVHDFGFQDQIPYLVMEYSPNGTLRTRHPKGTRLELAQIILYLNQIAPALDYAHQQRVIHRDVKPVNILLTANDEVVLSDFGLAVVQQSLDSHSTHNQA